MKKMVVGLFTLGALSLTIQNNYGFCCFNNSIQDQVQEQEDYPLEQITVSEKMADQQGNREIHTFVLNGDVLSVSQQLIKTQRDLNAKNARGNTPLHFAALQAFKPENTAEILEINLRIVDLLLRYGANPNIQNNTGETPLHIALSSGYWELFLRLLDVKGINVNLQDCNGNTPMHIAYVKNHLASIRLLLEKRPDLRPKNKDGFSIQDWVKQSSAKKNRKEQALSLITKEIMKEIIREITELLETIKSVLN